SGRSRVMGPGLCYWGEPGSGARFRTDPGGRYHDVGAVRQGKGRGSAALLTAAENSPLCLSRVSVERRGRH
ncbi:uncharacterized protein LY79DRAFT_523117, partial [Colletotrichum navitas]